MCIFPIPLPFLVFDIFYVVHSSLEFNSLMLRVSIICLIKLGIFYRVIYIFRHFRHFSC